MAPVTTARRFRIHGRVQGVFFREWTVREAMNLGVTGWVRNRSDSTVEVLAVAADQAINSFAERLKEGPPAASIERIDVEEAPLEEFRGFARRPTG